MRVSLRRITCPHCGEARFLKMTEDDDGVVTFEIRCTTLLTPPSQESLRELWEPPESP